MADAPNIVPFRMRDPLDEIPEEVLPLPRRPTPVAAAGDRAPALDLSGKRKVWFVVGRGGVGKTMLLRWTAEIVAQRGGEVICAAVDPMNRSWRLFHDAVEEPTTNEPRAVAAWLRDLLTHVLRDGTTASALIDLGGGDTSLGLLLQDVPDLAVVMDDAGVAPVMVHVVGANPQDLVPMAEVEAAGFCPAATLIVCNERLDRRDRFARVLRHSTVRAALERGAQQVWMPYMTADTATLVDARHLPFLQVGNNLGPFHGASVRGWLKAMGNEFAPVLSWLP